jgi:antitoxin component YwqK of YwqJK toxin-antitoxin module
MKAMLFALFVALLMVGCGESSIPKAIDLDDPTTLDRIIAEAIDVEKAGMTDAPILPWNHRRRLAPGTQKPYTGWMKSMYANGRVKGLSRLKDGIRNGQSVEFYENGRKESAGSMKDHRYYGLQTQWYENGQKWSEQNYKDGAKISEKRWYKHGQKEREINYKGGPHNPHGLWVEYKEDGTENFRATYKDGEQVFD